jgi:hypothetical protein
MQFEETGTRARAATSFSRASPSCSFHPIAVGMVEVPKRLVVEVETSAVYVISAVGSRRHGSAEAVTHAIDIPVVIAAMGSGRREMITQQACEACLGFPIQRNRNCVLLHSLLLLFESGFPLNLPRAGVRNTVHESLP